MRVLVVEDDVRLRKQISKLISSRGYECREAADGQEALEILQAFNASVIVTDLRMPRMDGFELMKRLRRDNALPPTIVMTGFGSVELATSVVHELGGFWFLEKPIDPQSLQVLLERAWAHGRLERDACDPRRRAA